MPARAPASPTAIIEQLAELGAQIRARRRGLGVNGTAAAEAAGISRVTLHRIERGEPAVTIGAYLNAASALGLRLNLASADITPGPDRGDWIPVRIALADYPQLRQLAWQVRADETLTPAEAWDIYQRNWRHVDAQALTPGEQQLVEALRRGLGNDTRDIAGNVHA